MAAAMLVAACQPVAQDRPDPGTTEAATVTWIYDGDTVEVEQSGRFEDIRLVGINAPDSGECYYAEALEFLIHEIKGGQVELSLDGRDQFDRTLAYVWADATLVNLDLVERGLAIATTPHPDDVYGPLLVEAEEQARADGTGLWGSTVCSAGGEAPELTLDVDPYDEVVTIGNAGQDPVDLTNYWVRDESSRHRYRFSPGTILPPGHRIDITSADTGWQPGETNVWNNNGDMAMIMDGNGRVVAAHRYP